MAMASLLHRLVLIIIGVILCVCYTSSSSPILAHPDHHKSDGSSNLKYHHRNRNVSSHGEVNKHDKSKLPRLWPLPRHFRSGEVDRENGRIRYIALSLEQAQSFRFDVQWGETHGLDDGNGAAGSAADVEKTTTTPPTSSSILIEAFERYRSLIFNGRPGSGLVSSISRSTPLISSLLLHVHSPLDTLRYGADESYELEVPDAGNTSQALLRASTVFGALRGLETFSQLCAFDFESRRVQIRNAPWSIADKPRFLYRGLLIDTARHYQPLRVIKQVIDAMSYAKLNVLHWHMVDTQSFPLEIPSYPKLWQGSFSPWERYTMEDAKDIVEYAHRRGINVMAELDVPGHAASWGVGYPQLLPSPNCSQPLDVSRNFTFHVIDGILSDFAKTFSFDFVHMGGDEVNTSCWTQIPRIKKWLRRNNYTGFDAYKHFVLQAETLSAVQGYTPVNWEEPFDLFGAELNKKTVIHNWLDKGVAPKIVKAGFRCIVSNQNAWYLDHLNVPWQTFYSNEPWTNITKAGERALVLGGEVCMWGEMVDASDIQQTIWPRAAAAAERLWSSLDNLAEEPEDALPRLRHFRCLLNERGIAAAPVVSRLGRDPPQGPGSCYSQ